MSIIPFKRLLACRFGCTYQYIPVPTTLHNELSSIYFCISSFVINYSVLCCTGFFRSLIPLPFISLLHNVSFFGGREWWNSEIMLAIYSVWIFTVRILTSAQLHNMCLFQHFHYFQIIKFCFPSTWDLSR